MNKLLSSLYVLYLLSSVSRADPSTADPTTVGIDTITFGDPSSEQAHGLRATASQIFQGALNQPARRLLPGGAFPWQGGNARFTMKVDGGNQNYITVKFWGSDPNNNRLILFCEGKQIGYRHLGDIDILDTPNGSSEKPGCFFYTTSPLPLALTQGKSDVRIEVLATGPVWGYGTYFAQYQKPMAGPSRGFYRAYTHTTTAFVPSQDEAQGSEPTLPPIRKEPGPEVLDQVKDRVNHTIAGMLTKKTPLTQAEAWFLSKAYYVKWTPAYRNAAIVNKVTQALDVLYCAYRQDPEIVHGEKSIYNSSWFGLGPAAQSVVLLSEPMAAFLDHEIEGAPGIARRAGWSQMFLASRDWHRENRRQYTNQTMISDTYGLYLCNRAVAALDPKRALPEGQALHYLYQSAGIEPWLGSEKKGQPLKPLGDHYYELTSMGLTKELGFVGYYGEVLDWMTSMYDATRPVPGAPGDPKIEAQLVKAARARAVFRYPALDDDGNKAMRAETIVGWRDEGHYPGDITYAQRPSWDGSPIESAAATRDPVLVGYAQQMLQDNQFFATVRDRMKESTLRVTAGLLPVPDTYETLNALPQSADRLPMTPGQPDFVFADPEDGVLAVKHEGEILYSSLYWRARTAVNFLARVHSILPSYDRIAVVHEDTKFTPSGFNYVRPDWVNMGFGNGGISYPDGVHSAHSGEKLPIALVPAGTAFKLGDENPAAGRGDFYSLRYGHYLVGMNTTSNKTYSLNVPAVVLSARDLSSGAVTAAGTAVQVPPLATVVLDLNQ